MTSYEAPNTDPGIGFWGGVATLKTDSEAEVEQRLILPMLRALGYADDEITPKYAIIFQTGRKGRPHEADFLVHHGPTASADTSLIVVEAKTPKEGVVEAQEQADSYARASRAPLLLLTDGVDLEIWQSQATSSSTRVLAGRVRDLASLRGRIEALIGRNAAIAHCRSLGIKPLTEAARDLGAYFAAELDRTGTVDGVGRRLYDRNNGKILGPTAAAAVLRQGAIVLAPSGFGKSTLAVDLHRAALATCTASDPVPFLISLVELDQLGRTPLDYAGDRLAAHCAHVSTAAFRDIAAERGVRLVLDGLDRIGSTARRTLMAQIATMLRDHPRSRVVLFGRTTVANGVGLEVCDLLPLNADEQRALAERLLGMRGGIELYKMPKLVEPLRENPLLLTLMLRFQERTGAPTRRIDELLEAWLHQLLDGDGDGPLDFQRQRSLLARIAIAIAGSARALAPVLADVGAGLEQDVERLAATGAILVGRQVELCHEAVGDYLRAEALLDLPKPEILDHVAACEFAAGSFYPVLLMTMTDDADVRQALWHRLRGGPIAVYLDVLRYHVPAPFAADQPVAAQGARFAAEFLAGTVDPLRSHFPHLERQVTARLLHRPGERLGVSGEITPDLRWFHYAYRDVGAGEPDVIAGPTSDGAGGGFDVTGKNQRNDARLVGLTRLRDAIVEVIARRDLAGGIYWTNDLLAGRLRFAARKLRWPADHSVDLAAIARMLEPHRDEIVWYDGGWTRNFTVRAMLDGIDRLQAAGATAVDAWWRRWEADPTDRKVDTGALAGALDEHWRRTQMILREVVEADFPKIAADLQFYQAMPVRFDVNVSWIDGFGHGASRSWFPTRSWNDAGADVTFNDGRDTNYDEGSYARIMTELARLGRHRCTSITYQQGSLPRFDGSRRDARFDGETSALRAAAKLLQADLKKLFERAPLTGGG